MVPEKNIGILVENALVIFHFQCLRSFFFNTNLHVKTKIGYFKLKVAAEKF